MKKFLFALSLAFPLAALADPVWDPTEIANLAQQASQLATNLSETINTLQTFQKLATQVGATGARPSFSSTAPASLAGYSTLQSAAMPAASDAAGLLSSGALTITQRQQTRRTWGGAYQTAASEGLSVSQVANHDAGTAVSRSKTLASGATGAQDLRGDLQANSAVGLALLSELGSVQAVLALLLEQQSLSRLSSIANNGTGS